MKYDIKDIKMAKQGKMRIEWADRHMPVLRLIRKRFEKEKPLKGMTIGACLHVTTETANLMRTLKAGGATVGLCASNPLSTQDDVAASLVKDYGIATFAVCGEDNKSYYKHVNSVLDMGVNITMDDGGDLVTTLLSKRKDALSGVIAGTEETTTGVIRFKSMEKDNVLKFPVIAVNDAYTKHMFDNRYGTGQSTIDGILRATNKLIAGSTVVVAGYGWCSRGVASRARGLGGNVVVTEVDPLKALEAAMDGHRVMHSLQAAKIGDIFISATGDIHVFAEQHFKKMKDGAIVANSGHFNVEIDIPALAKMAKSKKKVRDFVDEYTLKDGRRIMILGDGRLINLAAAEGHPASVMDMSFANQSLCAEYITKYGRNLEVRVHRVPTSIDETVSKLKLRSMGIKIDVLTKEQRRYLASWQSGT